MAIRLESNLEVNLALSQPGQGVRVDWCSTLHWVGLDTAGQSVTIVPLGVLPADQLAIHAKACAYLSWRIDCYFQGNASLMLAIAFDLGS